MSSAMDYIEGLLLGDGSIARIRQRNTKDSFAFSLTDSYKSYTLYLKNKLSSFEEFRNEPRIRPDRNDFLLKLNDTKFFRPLRKKWYIERKGKKALKRVPEDFEINSIKLKNWFIGDGKKPKGESPSISNFTLKNLDQILLQLREIFPALRIWKSEDKRRENYRGISIVFPKRKEFYKYILRDEDDIPPSYEYKFKGKDTRAKMRKFYDLSHCKVIGHRAIFDKDWLLQEYLEKEKSARQIARELDVSKTPVIRNLKEYGVEHLRGANR